MTSIPETLSHIDHRPWPLPERPWAFHMIWRDAVFLHWPIGPDLLRPHVPTGIDLDLFDGTAWVSVVAFTMVRVRPRGLPPLRPVSHFHEVNVRTYTRVNDRPGVFFLRIEAASRPACAIARTVSGLPYRHARMQRSAGRFITEDPRTGSHLDLNIELGGSIAEPSHHDLWLTERYAVHDRSDRGLVAFDVHHAPWPLRDVRIRDLDFRYPGQDDLLQGAPHAVHASPGVRVLTWDEG